MRVWRKTIERSRRKSYSGEKRRAGFTEVGLRAEQLFCRLYTLCSQAARMLCSQSSSQPHCVLQTITTCTNSGKLSILALTVICRTFSRVLHFVSKYCDFYLALHITLSPVTFTKVKILWSYGHQLVPILGYDVYMYIIKTWLNFLFTRFFIYRIIHEAGLEFLATPITLH